MRTAVVARAVQGAVGADEERGEAFGSVAGVGVALLGVRRHRRAWVRGRLSRQDTRRG
jgi:hypothetical protein